MPSKQQRLIDITAALTLCWFSLLALTNSNWHASLPLVLFIVFSSTTELGRFCMHWLIAPINILMNRPVGSLRYQKFSRVCTLLLIFLTSFLLLRLLNVQSQFFEPYVILFSELCITTLLIGYELPFVVRSMVKQLAPTFIRRYIFIWGFSGLAYVAFAYWTCAWLLIESEGSNLYLFLFVVFFVLLTTFKWLNRLVGFLRSLRFIKQKISVTQLPPSLSLNQIIAATFLFGPQQHEDVGFFISALFAMVLVTDIHVLHRDVFLDSQKSDLQELRETPSFGFDFWFCFFILALAIPFRLNSVYLLVISIVLFRDEWSFISRLIRGIFKPLNTPTLEGLFILNYNNLFFGQLFAARAFYKLQMQGISYSAIYRWNYQNGNSFVQLTSIVEGTNFVVLPIGRYSADYSDLTHTGHDWNYQEIKYLMLKAIERPFRIVVVILADHGHEMYVKSRDARRVDRILCLERNTGSDFFENGYQEFYEFLFLCNYLDEQPITSNNYLDEVNADTLKLNQRMMALLAEKNFDIHALYKSGLTPLCVLHRRTHEFSMVAGRFMELLNLIEVSARWLLIFERKTELDLSAEMQFSFGGVISEIRPAAFMDTTMFEDEKELMGYKAVLKSSFGFDQKVSLKFKVIDFLNWVVFIRNKTRGHGSPSRVSWELYELLEVNTIRLMQAIAAYYEPRIIMCTDKFYVEQSGMNFDFNYYHETPMPEGTIQRMDVPLIRHKQKDFWHTSNELMIRNDNIYMVSAVKKSHCEWICYNTGELIRPDVIVI
jgi:hypothetical protein